MNLGKITLITPPDKLFNLNLSYLLVKPSNTVKQQFQSILSKSLDDLNVFVFDEKVKHFHGIWHLFVLTGSICQFLCLFLFVA